MEPPLSSAEQVEESTEQGEEDTGAGSERRHDSRKDLDELDVGSDGEEASNDEEGNDDDVIVTAEAPATWYADWRRLERFCYLLSGRLLPAESAATAWAEEKRPALRRVDKNMDEDEVASSQAAGK
ncbi:hypothetical protein PInf_004774 [Phytophthora infestans]|nr:hypothetical protein PInf_004774 [Phytophthora infestans]